MCRLRDRVARLKMSKSLSDRVADQDWQALSTLRTTFRPDPCRSMNDFLTMVRDLLRVYDTRRRADVEQPAHQHDSTSVQTAHIAVLLEREGMRSQTYSIGRQEKYSVYRGHYPRSSPAHWLISGLGLICLIRNTKEFSSIQIALSISILGSSVLPVANVVDLSPPVPGKTCSSNASFNLAVLRSILVRDLGRMVAITILLLDLPRSLHATSPR